MVLPFSSQCQRAELSLSDSWMLGGPTGPAERGGCDVLSSNKTTVECRACVWGGWHGGPEGGRGEGWVWRSV